MSAHPACANDGLIARLKGGLIVSCQPVPGGAFDDADSVVRFALAARDAGARALRIEGVRNVAAVRRACNLPVIGLVKRDLDNSPVRITPFIKDVEELADAGADIIACDATDRMRPTPAAELAATAHACGRVAMADIATQSEGVAAAALGFNLIGTTMSGYTDQGPAPEAPDLALVAALAPARRPVIAEGRYNLPALAAAALRAGAHAVVVGSAITRPEHITQWFVAAARAASDERPVLAIDVGGTKTALALVSNGRIIERRQIATQPSQGADAWLGAAQEAAKAWRGSFAGVAAAVTGVVCDGAWTAANPDTLPVPAGYQLVSRLRQLFELPSIAVNDAQAAAWGEFRFGAGSGRDLVFLTISSGIGGGIVANGRLLTGRRGLAGHIGQFPVAGSRLEALASGFALARRAGACGQSPDARAVFGAVERGEVWAETLLDEAIAPLAGMLPGLQALFDPEIVVIGGGVGLAPGYLERLKRALCNAPVMFRPALVAARLGADAGLVGAADLFISANGRPVV